MQRASLKDMIVRRMFGVSTLGLVLGFMLLAFSMVAIASQTVSTQERHIVSLYVDGIESSVPTQAKTVGELIKNAKIEVGAYDLVEPSKDAKIEGDNYRVNIYRARPVTIIDNDKITKVKTPYQGAKMIAEKAGLAVYPEDKLTQTTSSAFVSDQIFGEKIIIDRATLVNAKLFGESQELRTHSSTISDLLQEKGIVIGQDDRVSVPVETILQDGMAFEVWREGKQTITTEEAIARPVSQVKDNTKQLGYKDVQTEGSDGKRKVTYELEIRNGQEFSRTELSSEILVQPVEQVIVIGTKSSGNGLSQAKGVYQFTDSNGVTHRETYYDLPMSVVMRNCGAGGLYTVREDGVKIDKDGYVIIAANLNRYPRCSVVETSLGLGKVYDTGGFAAVHPDGYDLATDWSNRNGI